MKDMMSPPNRLDHIAGGLSCVMRLMTSMKSGWPSFVQRDSAVIPSTCRTSVRIDTSEKSVGIVMPS